MAQKIGKHRHIVNAEVETGGSPIDSDNPLFVHISGDISTSNSTTDTLGAGATFTGTGEEVKDESVIIVSLIASHASATDGLSVQFSPDNTNWDHTDVFTIAAATAKTFTFQPIARYFRVVYTNGGVEQTYFRLQVSRKSTYVKPSSHRISDPISGEDDAELSKAVITALDGANTFVNINATDSGNLKVANVEDGLAIAKGDVAGTTFVHKFGDAPDFDTGDNEVTVWDGANDTLLGGGAMSYTYSATADIGLISSSSASDTGDIEIQGLDTNGNVVNQTITLNGQTDVDISGVGGTDLKRVFRMKNVGSSDFVGTVYLRTNGSTQTGGVPDTANTVRALVGIGGNQTLMAIYTIPTGKTGYLRSFFASTAGAKKDTNYVIKVKARPSGQVFQLKHKTAISATGTSHFQHKYVEPEVFSAGTDVEMTAQITETTITEADVATGFDIVLVDD